MLKLFNNKIKSLTILMTLIYW